MKRDRSSYFASASSDLSAFNRSGRKRSVNGKKRRNKEWETTKPVADGLPSKTNRIFPPFSFSAFGGSKR